MHAGVFRNKFFRGELAEHFASVKIPFEDHVFESKIFTQLGLPNKRDKLFFGYLLFLMEDFAHFNTSNTHGDFIFLASVRSFREVERRPSSPLIYDTT